MDSLTRPDRWIPLAALAAGLAVALVFRLVLRHHTRMQGDKLADSLSRHTTRPLFLLLPVLFARAVQPLLALEPAVVPAVRQAATLLLIVSFGWLLISLVSVFHERVRDRLLSGIHDDRRAKSILTRVAILNRVLIALIAVLTAAAMLVTFPEGRALGGSILASAGIVGLVLGIAARPAAENLIAGLQVALTEPFSLEDRVVVEGELGRIEEIRATYVVVRTWDRRRVVVPLGHFLDRPFQNWTRSGGGLMGQVTIEVDYRAPVAKLREEIGAIVATSALWDRESWKVQVVEAGERTIRLRILATVADPSDAFDLCCEIRERVIAHLQENYPWALPRIRATIEGGTTP